MRRILLPIDKLHFNSYLYPRVQIDQCTVKEYAEAMKQGAIFPQIKVGRCNGGLHVVDGWHRIKARQLLKQRYIEAKLTKYGSREEMLLAAIKSNIEHGKRLTPQDKTKLIPKLQKMNFQIEKIRNILLMPVDQVQLIRSRTTGPKDVTEDNHLKLFRQVLRLLEADGFELNSAELRAVAKRIHWLLSERLEGD